MKAYSQDVRERVLGAVDQGRPRAEIVRLFGISLATLKRSMKQWREEGHMRPKAIPGRPPKKRVLVEAGVLPLLQANADATLDHEPSDQKTWLDAKEKVAWDDRAQRGRTGCLAGERARGSVPRNRGKNTTLIAVLSLKGMGAALILEGSANTAAFELYVEQVLTPSLHVGQIVVMDNLRAHKSARVRTAIEAKGCQLLFSTSLLT